MKLCASYSIHLDYPMVKLSLCYGPDHGRCAQRSERRPFPKSNIRTKGAQDPGISVRCEGKVTRRNTMLPWLLCSNWFLPNHHEYVKHVGSKGVSNAHVAKTLAAVLRCDGK